MAVAEYIARLNYKLILGSFQMDMSDGEVVYTHANGIGDEFDDETMSRIIGTLSRTVGDHAQNIARLMYTNASPVELLEGGRRNNNPEGDSEDGDGEGGISEALLMRLLMERLAQAGGGEGSE